MKTEKLTKSEAFIQGTQQLELAADNSRRAFFGKAAAVGLGLATGLTTTSAETSESGVVEAKIRRALLAGPAILTKDATVIDTDSAGNRKVLHQGTNKCICTPGDENKIGDPLCVLTLQLCNGSPTSKRGNRSLPTPHLGWLTCFAERHSEATSPPLTQQVPPSPSVHTG